jgi:ArsR family transcriptional regulator
MTIYKLVEKLNQLGQAIADPTRVRILTALLCSELCVCELVDALEVSQSTLSSHLQVLRQIGMVITRKEGRWVYYSLDKRKAALVDAIFSLVERDIGSNPRLIRDAQRIEGRLAIRENGRCTLGFSELEKSEVLSHARTS